MMIFLPIIEYDQDYMRARADLQREFTEYIIAVEEQYRGAIADIAQQYQQDRVALVHEFYQHRGQPERT